jgi:hypothetical protein
MRKQKLTLMLILATCSLTLTICSMGCSPGVTFYPLEGDHIINVAADEEFTAPRDGYFLSDEYFKKVLKAQVKEF